MPDVIAEPILVWGGGAIGGTIGAHLIRAGHDVTFVDIDGAHVDAINTSGLAITGPIEEFRVTAKAFRPDAVHGTWRHAILAVKAQHTEAATRALAPRLAGDGYILSAQNGLNERVIAGIVGAERTIGAFVNFSADWMRPGEVMFGGRGAVVLGELDGRMTERLARLHATLLAFEPGAITTPTIWGYLWGKLGYAAMLFAQALGAAGIADCLARPELLPLWRALGQEAVAVALAEGVEPLGFNGYDPQAFTPDASVEAAAASVAAMVAFNRSNAKTHSGVWRDLWVRHRRTEIDAQILPIAEIGAKHGLACPKVRALVARIHECETGARAMDDNNLLELLRA